MKATEINIIDSYYGLLKNLSLDNKLELIARLLDSMNSKKQVKKSNLKSKFGDFISEKTTDELIKDLRQARTFNRKREEF